MMMAIVPASSPYLDEQASTADTEVEGPYEVTTVPRRVSLS